MKGTWRLCSAGVGLSFVWLKGSLMRRGILSYWFSCEDLDFVLLYSRSGRGWSYTLRIDALRPVWKTLLSIRNIETTVVVPPVYFDKRGRGAPYLPAWGGLIADLKMLMPNRTLGYSQSVLGSQPMHRFSARFSMK